MVKQKREVLRVAGVSVHYQEMHGNFFNMVRSNPEERAKELTTVNGRVFRRVAQIVATSAKNTLDEVHQVLRKTEEKLKLVLAEFEHVAFVTYEGICELARIIFLNRLHHKAFSA